MVTAEDAGEDILFEHRGALGLVTLNRPKALNALTHAMALALEAKLDAWAKDDAVQVVAIQGAGDRAFCAGGDIRALYEAGRPGGERGRANFQFYADEYRLNAKIKRFPKPYVALMDGIVMGGGVGVSIHGSHRIATERTVFAMPETGIGLFPDVGATWFLPRLHETNSEIDPSLGAGLWLGLTGARLRAGDAVTFGIADLFCPSSGLEVLIDALAGGRAFFGELNWHWPGQPETLDLYGHHGVDLPTQGPGSDYPFEQSITPEIEMAFDAPSLAEILDRLAASQTEWGATQRRIILSKSPTCTEIAFRQIRAGAALSFEECMRLEYRLARFCMTHPDFYEGVRATIIDKDGAPAWSPATLAEVDQAAL
ncbi:MAG: enoyl-CoA hydratase/isomerase family protein, partial [Pseudomonadota bacterium]